MEEESRVKICHVITDLSVGGAEMMLTKLLEHRRRTAWEHEVISLMPLGVLEKRVIAAGVRVHTLPMRRGFPSPRDIRRLNALARARSPDVLQGWMYHGNLAAWRMWRVLHGKPRLYWNIRHSITRLADEKTLTRWLIRGGARLSTRPHKILYNSEAAADQHEALGYDAARRLIIPNGFDLARWLPEPEKRAAVRERFGLPPDAVVIGMVARFHPMKDHATLLRAATIHLQRHPNTRFVLAGRGVDPANPALTEWTDERIHLLGEQEDIAGLMQACDLLASSSAWGEAFPNVLGEAMACGVPCVATDVGDARRIIGDTGRVVPARDPQSLAEAWTDLLGGDLKALGVAARRRVEERYPIERIVDQYETLYAGET